MAVGCASRPYGFGAGWLFPFKSLMIELYKILEGMTPNYLSELFVKADTRITPEINVD